MILRFLGIFKENRSFFTYFLDPIIKYATDFFSHLPDPFSSRRGRRKETEEETGYRIEKVEKVFESYMSPGSVTEILYFFVAEYHKDMKVSDGGGIQEEQENIEVLELAFDQALAMIKTGEIRDGKTIMLLQYAQIHQLLD